jgi:hypothetical protein
MGLAHSPRIVTTNLLLNLDFANVKSNTGANSVINIINTDQFISRNNTWITYAASAITFTRPANTSPNPKIGGVFNVDMTGPLASPTYLYNDHTTEVWVRINDRNPGLYDPTEGESGIINYRGFHSGLMYNASSLSYFIWDSVGTIAKTAATWTLGTSGTQIVQNNWTQIVVTRSGNTFTPYVNGVQLGTGSTITTNTFTGTSNTLCIGGVTGTASTTPGTGSYMYYPNNSISCVKMYNRALSAAEVSQNFNALRGRFGL